MINSNIFFFLLLFLTFPSAIACKKEASKNTQDSSLSILYKDVHYYTGDTIRGYKNYVHLIVGDMDSPLFLGVPHDGIGVGNPEIPETGKTGRDINTGPFSEQIALLFEKDTKKKPWLMVNNIHRKRMDPNSYPNQINERYTEEGIKTYNSYHELLLLARNTLSKNHQNGKGALFLNVHGHAHKYNQEEDYISILTGKKIKSKFIPQVEIGYGLSIFSLNQDDEYLNNLADSSSIFYLSKKHLNIPFSQMIRGEKSFGGLLEAEGVKSVPGSKIPKLEQDKQLFGLTPSGEPMQRPYFTGGFVTRKYGTVRKGKTIGFDDNVISIQIEVPGINVRNNGTLIDRSAHQFKRALINYLNQWMGYSYTNSSYPFTYYN